MPSPRLLVIEGNSPQTTAEHVAVGGTAASKGYSDLLRELLPGAVVDICYPGDPTALLPEGSSLAGISAELSPRYMPIVEAEDAWGNTMSYASDGRAYSVVSSGPDGVSGSSDDVTLRDGAVVGGR